MSNQGTIRLKVTNGAPAIEKLWNGRFKLEFFCDNNSPKEDWYYENVSALLPDYGILQTTNFGSGVSEDWEAIPGSVYPDMRLVLAEYPYNVRAGKHYVKLTYETLTAAWVEEKDEDTDYELNGLKRVSRTFVALPDTAYDKVVGTSTIDSDGTTLYLGGFKIEETDAKWSLSEIWLEAGELSRDENSEDAKGSISITQIGGCPTAPAGYTVVNESKNNTQGFETCSRTFYKDDSELSRSNDYVGSRLAETIEVFSPTVAPTPTNGTAVLGNKSTSNVDGIPTIRYTFLEPSILSLVQEFIGGKTTVVVEAFAKTEAEVDTAIAAITSNHLLVSQVESDLEGIKTTKFNYEIDAIEIVSSPSSSLLSIQEAELSINNLTRGVIGSSTKSYEGKTLYLGEETIDNNNAIKTRTRVWLEAGILNETEPAVGQDFLRQKSITWQGVQGSDPSGFTFAGKTVQNVNGFQTITAQYYNNDDINGVETFTYNTTQQFTIPGTVTTGASGIGKFYNLMLVVTPPVSTSCWATVAVSYSTSGSVNLPANFYQPRGGVAVKIEGIGYFNRPFASTSSYSNHVRKSGGSSSSSMIQGNPLFANTVGRISISGNTDDPAGRYITVSAKATPVFRLDGTQYFRHELVSINVPSRIT